MCNFNKKQVAAVFCHKYKKRGEKSLWTILLLYVC